MTNPVAADGQPIPEGMVAVVDETVAELQGGVTYVLAAVTHLSTGGRATRHPSPDEPRVPCG